MAIIQSGTTTDLLIIDPFSKAARVTMYDINGNPVTSLDNTFVSATISLLNSSLVIPLGGQGGITIQISNTTGTLTAVFEATIDGTNWFSFSAISLITGVISSSTSIDGKWTGSSSGYVSVRVRISSFSVGAMTVSLRASASSQLISLAGSLSTITSIQGSPNTVDNSWPIKISDGVDFVGISTVSGAKALKVDVIQAVGGGAGGSSFGAANPLLGSASGFSDGTNMQMARAFDADTGAGTEYVLGSIIRLPSNGGSVAGGTSTNPIRIDTTGTTTQPISAVALPLPSGASTSAAQTTGNTSLSSIDSKFNSLGQKNMAGSAPVVIASDQGAVPISGTVTSNIGTTGGLALDATLTGGTQKTLIYDGTNTIGVSADPVRTDPTGTTTQPVSGTVTSNIGTTNGLALDSTVTTLSGKFGSLGQKNMAGSAPVVIASDQSAVPISGTVTSNIGTTGGLALDATVSKLTIAQGAALGSNTQAMVAGSVTTAAPTYITGNVNPLSLTTSGALRIDGSSVTQPVSGTITANIGTSGSLALDSTLTTLSGKFGSLGQKNMAGSAPVVIASDQGAISISGTVTSNVGTTGGLALDVTLTDGTQKTLIYDGTNTIGVSAHPIRTDPTGTTTQPVSGTITANIGTSGSLALDSTLTTLSGKFGSLGQKNMAGSAPVVIASDQSAVPISGTVTSNIGTTGGLALDTTVSKLTIAQGAALGSNTQAMVAGSVTTAAPTYITGNINPLSLTTSGALRIDGSSVTQPVSGTITANIGTSGSLALDSTLTTLSGKFGSLGQKNMAGSAPVVIASDQSAIPISGTVTSNIGTTGGLALDTTASKLTIAQGAALGSNTQAMVAGSVTTAAPTYITGNINPLSLTTSGALRIDGSSVIQPVSGTVTSNIGTTNGLALDSTLTTLSGKFGSLGQKNMAGSAPVVIASDQSAIPVSGTFALPTDLTTTNTISALNAALTVTSAQSSSASFQISGTWVGTLSFEATVDGTNWQSIRGRYLSATPGTSSDTTTATANGIFTMPCGSFAQIRARFSLYTSGSAVITVITSADSRMVTVTTGFEGTVGSNTPLNAGLLGVKDNGGLLQPIVLGQALSASAIPVVVPVAQDVVAYAGSASKINVALSTLPALTTGAATIGAVTAPGAAALALDATLTGGTQKTLIYDGTNTIGVSAHPVRTDPTGTTTQPVSGTVTSNIGTTNGLALDTTLTTLSGKFGSLGQKNMAGSAPVTMASDQPPIGFLSATGTITNTQSIVISTTGAGGVTWNIVGTWTGTIVFEGSIDGTNWGLVSISTPIFPLAAVTSSTTANGQWTAASGAYNSFRVRGNTVASGTATVVINVAPVGNIVVPIQTIASNLNATVTGTVTSNIGTTNGLALDATLTGGTQKTLIYDGTNTIGVSAHPVRTDPTGTTTQPVSGTVTSNIGTTNGLALDATLTGGTQKTLIYDGTNTIGTSTHPVTVGGPGTTGSSAVGNPVLIGGSDGGGLTRITAVTTRGELYAVPAPGIGSQSSAFEASHVISASAADAAHGSPAIIRCYNKGALQTIMLFNATSLPANGALALTQLVIGAANNINPPFIFPIPTSRFGTGLVVALSSSNATLTVTASADGLFSWDLFPAAS